MKPTCVLSTVAALLGVACGGAPGAEPAPAVPHVTPIEEHAAPEPPVDDEPITPRPAKRGGDEDGDPFEGTTGITEKPRPTTEAEGSAATTTPVLRDVRAARHEHFDRVVFEFEGDALPGYHIEYIDKPVRRCGSGVGVEVAGRAWLAVRMTPAAAHGTSGKPTVPAQQRKLTLDAVKELAPTCDFEGDVTWVLGVSERAPYRALTLKKPSRLVVDVKH
jgi:hypothetical protein